MKTVRLAKPITTYTILLNKSITQTSGYSRCVGGWNAGEYDSYEEAEEHMQNIWEIKGHEGQWDDSKTWFGIIIEEDHEFINIHPEDMED